MKDCMMECNLLATILGALSQDSIGIDTGSFEVEVQNDTWDNNFHRSMVYTIILKILSKRGPMACLTTLQRVPTQY